MKILGAMHPPPPKIFWMFAGYWQLPARLTRRWWAALSAARWSRASELRMTLLLHNGAFCASPRALIHNSCAPTEIAKVLEDLVREGLLERAEATRIEEAVLDNVTAGGTWR